jgi:hypothetical protein
MRFFHVPVLALLSVLSLLGACSNTQSGGGGSFVAADTKGCDGNTGAGCIGFQNPDVKNSDGSESSVDSSTDSEVLGSDSVNADDTLATDDGGDLDGFFDDPDATTVTDTGPLNSDCNERAKIVYVVTEQKDLLSFQPDTLTFKKVGKLGCSAGALDTPFSMSVDRNATAWVLYQSGFTGGGKLFQVSTLDASCKTTSFPPSQGGLDLFGMGFSSNALGSTDETLFVAGGGSGTFQTTKNTLASIAFPSMVLTTVGKIDISGGADLTGNGKGELFGFFPDSSPPSVRQIDKSNAQATTLQSWPLPANVFKNTQAWAFAQWGGNFYLFFQSLSDTSTNVWKLDPATGSVTKVLSNIGYTVTGAGVSSCAPTAAP